MLIIGTVDERASVSAGLSKTCDITGIGKEESVFCDFWRETEEETVDHLRMISAEGEEGLDARWLRVGALVNIQRVLAAKGVAQPHTIFPDMY